MILAPTPNTGQRPLQIRNENDARLSHFGNSVFNEGQLRRGSALARLPEG
jgi:ribosomal protein RSM22 (predicted rRNA methylase)